MQHVLYFVGVHIGESVCRQQACLHHTACITIDGAKLNGTAHVFDCICLRYRDRVSVRFALACTSFNACNGLRKVHMHPHLQAMQLHSWPPLLLCHWPPDICDSFVRSRHCILILIARFPHRCGTNGRLVRALGVSAAAAASSQKHGSPYCPAGHQVDVCQQG